MAAVAGEISEANILRLRANWTGPPERNERRTSINLVIMTDATVYYLLLLFSAIMIMMNKSVCVNNMSAQLDQTSSAAGKECSATLQREQTVTIFSFSFAFFECDFLPLLHTSAASTFQIRMRLSLSVCVCHRNHCSLTYVNSSRATHSSRLPYRYVACRLRVCCEIPMECCTINK